MKRLILPLLLMLGATHVSLAQESSSVAESTIVIRGGSVIDGTGTAARQADVLIRGDKIVAVGEVEVPADATVIDATGKVVTPGFIDTHAHGSVSATPEFHNFLAQGVTTICLGQDGGSPFGTGPAEWMKSAEEARPGPNVAAFVGHGTVRRVAGVGMSTEPSDEGIAKMVELVREAMEAGCFGMSTGLEYEPGRFSELHELIAAAGPVGEVGGVVMSHMRSEDAPDILNSVTELLTQCRVAGADAHASHLKIVYAKEAEAAEEVLELMAQARAQGMQVTADVYPYIASHTGIGIVFPDWARPPADFEEIKNTRREELEESLRWKIESRNGPEATLFGSGEWSGKTLAEVAEELGKPFEDVLIDDIGPGGASAAYFVMAEPVMRRFLQDSHVMVCTDGSPTMRHPRGYGAFAKVIDDYVFEHGLFPIEEAIRKMTGLPAATIGLLEIGRGRVAPGFHADLLVFDPESVEDTATFEEPHQLAKGFDTILVNGTIVRRDGEFTGERSGRVLQRKSASGAK